MKVKEENVNEELKEKEENVNEEKKEKEENINEELKEEEENVNEEKKENNVQFLYFVPFSVSGITNKKINKIIKSEFPPCMKNVKKLIFSTSFTETLNVNELSVVIDMGLIKEEIFNPSIGLSKYVIKLASNESKNTRKGRLGRLMKGLYISFRQKDKNDKKGIPSTQKDTEIEKSGTPTIQIRDLTKNYLMMKQVNIDLGKMNLIYKPNKKNLEVAINTLVHNGAIDENSFEITELGNEILRFDFIPIQYATTVAKYSKSFTNLKEKRCANFISSYISLIIANAKLLIKDEKPDKLLQFFDDGSDIVTLFNALNSLLKGYKFDKKQKRYSRKSKSKTPSQSNYTNQAPSLSSNIDIDNNNRSFDMNDSIDIDSTSQTPIIDIDNNNDNENQKYDDIDEKYGFHPFKIKELIKNLHTLSDYLFPGENPDQITNELSVFMKNHNIYDIIDDFIQNMNDQWKEIHYFDFKIARFTKTEKKPELVFLGSEKLIFDDNKNQTHGKVFLTKRPGWKGIIIPSHCYIFDISINDTYQPYQKYIGHLIHSPKSSQKAFDAIELEHRYIFNPWFNVLLESYFSKDIKNNKNISDVISFHQSRISDKIFLSFINSDNMKSQIKDAVNNCVKLLPFTPRSVLIYKNTPKSQGFIETITEINGIGSFDYNSMDSTFCRGAILDKNLILHCINNLNELSLVDAKIRICSLFVNDTCDPSEYDTKNLYVIDMLNENVPGIGNLKDVVKETYNNMKYKIKKKKNEVHSSQNPVKYGNFQFSPRLVNPSLFAYKKSRENVMDWFNRTFPNVFVKEVRNHNLKMKITDIHAVQDKIDKDLIKIETEMNLDYVAISFPLEIKNIITNEHKDWYVHIDKKHNTIISPKEKLEEIMNFIREKRKQSKSKKAASYFASIGTLPSFCYNACADPGNSKLTDTPITYYFENGETYTSKLCQSCIYSSLCYATQRFYTNEKTNSDYLFQIKKKPSSILKIPSKFNKDGTKCWPQVPLGQLISVLFDNDDTKLTSILSAYLRSINDYTMRYKMQKWLTFCPDHFDKFYEINDTELKCSVPGCQNFYCDQCKKMHINIDHEDDVTNNKCQNCGWPYVKEEGCDIIECPYCGHYFCDLCGKEFKSYCAANLHLSSAHRISKYSFEYETDSFYG